MALRPQPRPHLRRPRTRHQAHARFPQHHSGSARPAGIPPSTGVTRHPHPRSRRTGTAGSDGREGQLVRDVTQPEARLAAKGLATEPEPARPAVTRRKTKVRTHDPDGVVAGDRAETSIAGQMLTAGTAIFWPRCSLSGVTEKAGQRQQGWDWRRSRLGLRNRLPSAGTPLAAVARIRCGRRLVRSAGWGRPGRVVACSRAAQRKSAFRRPSRPKTPLVPGGGMARYGQLGARTRLFRGGGMRILRSLITYRDTGQVGALPDIKGPSRWPLRFLGRRDRHRRGRLLSTVRGGLVLITHRSHPFRQDPGVLWIAGPIPATLHSAASPLHL